MNKEDIQEKITRLRGKLEEIAKEDIQERLQNFRDDLEEIEIEIERLEQAELYTIGQQIKTNWQDPIQDAIHHAIKAQIGAAYKKKEELEKRLSDMRISA